MNSQCQGCGAYEGGNKPTAPCEHCGATICSGCKSRHVERCEDIQKARKSGQGQTVRQVLETGVDPAPQVEDERTVLFTPAPPIPEGQPRLRYIDDAVSETQSLTPEAAAGLAEAFAAEIEAQTPAVQENAPEAAPEPATPPVVDIPELISEGKVVPAVIPEEEPAPEAPTADPNPESVPESI